MNQYSIKVVLYFDPNYRKPDRNIIYAKIQGVMVYSPLENFYSIEHLHAIRTKILHVL